MDREKWGVMLCTILVIAFFFFFSLGVMDFVEAQTREPRPTPSNVPSPRGEDVPLVELRTMDAYRDIIRIVDYDHEIVCYTRAESISCVRMP